MRRLTVLFSLSVITLLLSACNTLQTTPSALPTAPSSTLPATFTTENVMKLHQGMSSDEILAMFGEPKNLSVAVCGMPPDQWNCTRWEYGEFPHARASFTFGGKHNALKLNNFNIER